MPLSCERAGRTRPRVMRLGVTMTPNTADHDPIRHVVMLILENHSFDQMLGCFKQIYPTLDGVDPNQPRRNVDDAGRTFVQAPTTERIMFLDPHHEVNHVAV